MSILGYIETAPLYDLTIYDNSQKYLKDGIAFSGTPRRHLYSDKKIILIPSTSSRQTVFYEFRKEDILHVEDLANPVNEKGEGMRMIKIWVQKGAHILRCEPIIAE